MAVIGTPITDGGDDPGILPDLSVITATDATRDGCPVLTRTRTLIAAKGQSATLEWQFRTRDGLPIDLSELIAACAESSMSSVADCHHVKVRFADALLEGCSTIVEADATITDAETGTVQVNLPENVAAQSGIYQVSWGIVDTEGTPLYVENGLLSVEHGLWGDLSQATGPPTLQDIRLRMRDTQVDNQLLDEVEFSDAEILNALLQPIREFNEVPPPLGYKFNGRNFPYKYYWVEATVAQLMFTAADWYRRNKMQTSHGGISLNDRDKDNPYLQTAMLLRQEYRRFFITEKAALNAQQAYGSISSDYSRSYW